MTSWTTLLLEVHSSFLMPRYSLIGKDWDFKMIHASCGFSSDPLMYFLLYQEIEIKINLMVLG